MERKPSSSGTLRTRTRKQPRDKVCCGRSDRLLLTWYAEAWLHTQLPRTSASKSNGARSWALLAACFCAQERVIKLVERPVDPFAPPKFKHKKAACAASHGAFQCGMSMSRRGSSWTAFSPTTSSSLAATQADRQGSEHVCLGVRVCATSACSRTRRIGRSRPASPIGRTRRLLLSKVGSLGQVTC